MARVRQTARKRAVGAGKSRAKAAAVNAGAEAESETESESESWLDKVDGFGQADAESLAFDKQSAVNKRIFDVGRGPPAAPCDNKLVYSLLIPVGYICICNTTPLGNIDRFLQITKIDITQRI